MSVIDIQIYRTDSGREPFIQWIKGLDKKVRIIIADRLDRISINNFGDAKRIHGAQGIWEIRIDYGPGYRIYFGKVGIQCVILLVGGNKKNQSQDIKKAKDYWADYSNRSWVNYYEESSWLEN